MSKALTFEAGLADAAHAREDHPLHPYHCRNCGRPIRALEWDGYCRHCAGEPEADLAQELQAAARQGHVNAAGALYRLAGRQSDPRVAQVLRERARKHEEWADHG